MMENQNAQHLSLIEKQKLVAEARETFGVSAARELWHHLGLPETQFVEVSEKIRGEQVGWPKFMARIPPDAKSWIAAEATRNASSQNSELVRCIRERMEQSEIVRALAARQDRVTAERKSLAGEALPSLNDTTARQGGHISPKQKDCPDV